MSELKVYIHPLKKSMMGNTIVGQSYYLKSEADKYIDLLKDKANYNEYAYKLKSEELADTCRFYEEELRHHKFKRCLAMAEWCNSEMGRETFACFRPRHTKEVWREEHKYWAKWRKIWFELTQKFKEGV